MGRAWMFILAALAGGGGLAGTTAGSQETLRTFVPIPPLAYLVERVGGAGVKVDVLVEPGQDPHSFEPTPRQIANLARARLYFKIGLPFENRVLRKIKGSMRGLEVVDAAQGIKRRPMEGLGKAKADHGRKGHPEPPGKGAPDRLDPHIWLDPTRVKTLAANICAALKSAEPSCGERYERNLKLLKADLDRLDQRIRSVLGGLKVKELFVYHPAFGYFTDAYGLKQVAVEVGGKRPSARQLVELIRRARRAGVRVIFVSPEFPKHSAETVARAIGGAVVQVNPLARDYIKNMERIATSIREALRSAAGQRRGADKG